MSSPVPCKICGALPDVTGTPVESCDVFSYFVRCSNDDCGFYPAVVDKETAITIWNSNNDSPAIQEADNPLVDAELDRDHCWHERRDAASLCCDCEGLRDFLHTDTTPVTPSDAVRKAAEPWRDEAGHAWEHRSNVECVECPHCCFTFAAIHGDGSGDGYSCPSCNGCPEAKGGDEQLPIEDLERDHFRDHPPAEL